MLMPAMPARRHRHGRPPLGPHPMTAGERKKRSRQVRPDTVQLNVEVAAEVRDTLRELAKKLNLKQAEVVAEALRRYAARRL